jgi:hypothetical protein
MPKVHSPSRFAVILAFGLVYLLWGSTYLAIDIAVQKIPPALMCAVRFSIAGVVMLAVCALTGRRIVYSARQIALAAVVGILLLMGGNLTLAWAELSVPSGLAALIIAITPLWFLVLDSLLLGHHRISWRGKVGLALGIAGLFILFWPELHSTSSLGRRELLSCVALLGGSFSWALGSVLSKRWQSGMDGFSATGWQMTAAGGRELIAGRCRRRFFASGVDGSRRGRGDISCGVWFVDRLHRLHLPAGTCADFESFDLCVRKSGDRSFPGMADSARARGPIYSDGKYDCCVIRHSGYQRESEGENDHSRFTGRGSRWVVSVLNQ